MELVIPHMEVPSNLIDPAFADRQAIFNAGMRRSDAPRVIGGLDETESERFSDQFNLNSRMPDMAVTNLKYKLRVYGELEYEQTKSGILYAVPEELLQFTGAIALIAQFEHSAYPFATRVRTNADVAIEQSRVETGSSQRPTDYRDRMTLHPDGDGSVWANIYLITDKYPTEVFATTEVQRNHDGYYLPKKNDVISPVSREYEIAAINSTTLHRSPVVPTTTIRTFMRMTYYHKLV